MATQTNYKVSDNGIVRDANEAEIIAIEENKIMFAQDQAKKIAAAQAKEIALSKLAALGLTADDLKALGLQHCKNGDKR